MTSTNAKTGALLAIQEQMAAAKPTAGAILELNTQDVECSALRDRLNFHDESYKQLVTSMRASGQHVPALVRQDQDRPGKFIIIAGHRRLAACQRLDIKLRAVIVQTDDRDALTTQILENQAREDLTFIERCKLALTCRDDYGMSQDEIQTLLGKEAGTVSRFLTIGRNIPDDVAAFIGRARKFGRGRWEKLSNALKDPDALIRARDVLATANPATASEEARYQLILEAAEADQGHPADRRTVDIHLPGIAAPRAKFQMQGNGLNIRISSGPESFQAWLMKVGGDALKDLYEQYLISREGDET